MRLPSSVQELAEVIGRERALFLVGMLPRCYMGDSRYSGAVSARVILYIPKRMRVDHELVRMMGWDDAEKLRVAFGGEILCPATCADLYRPFRDQGIRRMAGEGVPMEIIAEWFGMGPRRVKDIVAGGLVQEIPQEGIRAANDDSPPTEIRVA